MATPFSTRTTRPLSRRSFLRGAGVALGLPMLDAMTPAFARAAEPVLPRRMIAIQTNMGILPQHFFPKETGLTYTPSPYLEILKAHRDRITVFSGVSHPEVDGAHEAERSFLTASPHPGSSAFKSTISLDQLAAEQLGPVTRFPSFTLSVNAEGSQGMVFTRSGVKLPPERSPASLYRRMFVQGNAAEIEARLEDLRQGRSLLDFVAGNAKRLEKQVGAADRDRLDQYYTAVRDLETQLTLAQEWETKPKPKASTPEPKDITENKKLIDKIALMLEVARLGFESDSTRIITLFINTFSVVPEIAGVTQETHSLTHHGNRPEALDQLFRIESAHFRTLATFLDKLATVKEKGETLLDRTMVLYGTPMGSANSHSNQNLPILLAGGGFQHAGHLAFDTKKNYPLPNLYVSMLQKLGLPVDRFASSTGTMRGL
ncbi:DUF1552 domain-containing protein [soil metagenome]